MSGRGREREREVGILSTKNKTNNRTPIPMDVMTYACNPGLERLRQEDCKFKSVSQSICRQNKNLLPAPKVPATLQH